MLGALALVVDLADDSCVDGEEVVDSDDAAAVCVWFRRFCSSRGNLTPSMALPIRDNFQGILGRRVRRLGLSEARDRVSVLRGTDLRAALEVTGGADPQVVVLARDGDAAVDSRLNEEQRLS